MENGALTADEVFLKTANKQNTFEKLIERKYDEFLMGKVKPYSLDEIKVVEDKVFQYKVKKARIEDRLDVAEKTLSETMDKTGLKFSLYRSKKSILCPFSSAVLIKVSLIAALKDWSL